MSNNCTRCGGELRWSDVFIGWECESCGAMADDPNSLTHEEAEKAFDEAEDVPLLPERIDEIVRYATGEDGEQ